MQKQLLIRESLFQKFREFFHSRKFLPLKYICILLTSPKERSLKGSERVLTNELETVLYGVQYKNPMFFF